MIFGNPLLAWGALAFSIPLILHILNRSRFRKVEWGAMHLLESVINVNHKRFQFEQFLLLLVRCAIPALLAMCLARPILTGAKMLTGDAPVSLVIVVDTSYSMDAVTAGVSRFDQAIEAATAIVESVGRGSEVAVIQTGGSPTPISDEPVFDSPAVVRRLKTLQGGYGASDMQQALDAGLATLAGMSNVRRELIIISDFQNADWGAPERIAATVRQQLDSMPVKPELTLMQIGGDAEDNVAVESLEFTGRPLGVGQQLAVRATVRNHGKVSSEARVTLKTDGNEDSVSQVTLSANSVTQTLFTCSFDKAGSHVINVEVSANDSLETDNSLAASVTIWDQIDVLLVDGDPSSQPLKGETDFLSVALTPYSLGRLKLSDLLRTKTITAERLNSESLQNTKVVVMANVPRLSDNQVAELRSFVEAGGALIVASGNRIDPVWYNQHLFSTSGLLPAEFGDPRGKIDDQGQGSRMMAQHFDHPALQFFNDPANGDLSTAEVSQWYELKLPNVSSPILTAAPANEASDEALSRQADRNSLVIARLDNGDPFLVEHSVGDGVVIQMATSCDADWTDLPLRPVYVPMMQQMVMAAATQFTPPVNIQTGEPAVVMFQSTEPPDGDQTEAKPVTLSISTPDGARRNLVASPEGSKLIARFNDTRRPGIYTVMGPAGDLTHVVATTSREESDVSSLDKNKLAELAKITDAAVVESSIQYLEQDRLRRNGREIWKYVLIALLAFMFLELVLQQRFSRIRT